ncbi:MAG: hypothetical protein ACTJHU_11775, partial [Mycetocola sp.]
MTLIRRSLSRTPRPAGETPAAPSETQWMPLGLGLLFCGFMIFAYYAFRFFSSVLGTTGSAYSIAAWIILIAVVASGLVSIRRNGQRLTTRMMAILIPVLFAAFVLDRVGTVMSGLPHPPSTVVGAAAGVLVAFTPLRPTAEVLALIAGLAVVKVVPEVLFTLESGTLSALPLSGDVLVFLATLLAVALTASLRRMGSMAADRARLHGTLATRSPDTGHLPWAGAAIVKLDNEIEQLFTDIASGAQPLPLPAERSDRAAELAAELRLLLLSGKRDTWLNHAVADSAVLAQAISVVDPTSMASQLERESRDALVSALWLLCSGPGRQSVKAAVRFREDEGMPDAAGNPTRFIDIHVAGLRRRDIESALWEVLRQIGPHSTHSTALGVTFSVAIAHR